jgi:hypothetical protein
MDNDGDDDYLAMNFYTTGFRYFKNTGTATSPQFAAPVFNPFGLTTVGLGDVSFVEVGDIDLDGDLDVIAGEYDYGNWNVYINGGTAAAPSFAAPLVNPFGLTAGGEFPLSDLVDLDDDGDLDLLAFNYNGDAKYYQNNDPSASVDEVTTLVGLAPNPAKDRFSVDLGTATDWSVVVLNTAGQEVFRTELRGESRLDVAASQWPAGLYTVRAQSDAGVQTGQVVVQP